MLSKDSTSDIGKHITFCTDEDGQGSVMIWKGIVHKETAEGYVVKLDPEFHFDFGASVHVDLTTTKSTSSTRKFFFARWNQISNLQERGEALGEKLEIL